MTLLAGVDVGGTNLRVGVVDDLRLIYNKRYRADFSEICRTQPPDMAWDAIVVTIAHALDKALQIFPDITAIGIGFPGFIDPTSGAILQSPNLPGLHNVDLAGSLSKRLGRPVLVENDAVAAAYGEYSLQRNTTHSLVYIGLGTGVGGGFIHADKPFTGQNGTAMEIGHLIVDTSGTARVCGCGNTGCLERYASASGVATSYKLATGLELDAKEVAELAHKGDAHAIEAYRLAGTSLARAVAHIAKILDVSQIVIGGGLSNSWSLAEAAFNQQLQADLIPALSKNVYVRVSTSGDEAGIIGAAMLAS
jgi:glucokinase